MKTQAIPETRVTLICFKKGKECARADITRLQNDELKNLLEIQEMLGRTWVYKIED